MMEKDQKPTNSKEYIVTGEKKHSFEAGVEEENILNKAAVAVPICRFSANSAYSVVLI